MTLSTTLFPLVHVLPGAALGRYQAAHAPDGMHILHRAGLLHSYWSRLLPVEEELRCGAHLTDRAPIAGPKMLDHQVFRWEGKAVEIYAILIHSYTMICI